MIRAVSRTLSRLALLCLAASLGLACQPSERREEVEDGRPLELVSPDLEGWVIENGGRFSYRDGVIAIDRGTGWLRSKRRFSDFVLQIEFRFLDEGANSGIFVRTEAESRRDENGWPANGYQVQCLDTTEGDHPLGTMILYGAPPFIASADLEALARAYRPAGEWHQYEITCRGERLEVKLNGEVVTRARNIKNRDGHLGIQGEHGRLEFRRIEVRELTAY